TKKLGRELTDTETQDAKAFAKEVGYLPLALELATAQVADGIAWKVLLQDMQQEVARLKTLDNRSARDISDESQLKKLSLTASLNLSVKRLKDETPKNFIWLGILPEDVSITPKMTAKLWDMDDERDTEDELRYLKDKALAYTLQSRNPQHKADALGELADYLPDNLKQLALEKALEAAKLIQSEEYRAKVLSALALPLSEMPQDKLFSCWKSAFHHLSTHTRPSLLSDIENLVPVILSLGEEPAIAEIATSIQKVVRWWR
ncbi:MAG: hypothetical protein AAF316_15925, partial [Cyanobacteria bacterium P01_A01_bin.80]